MDHHAPARRGAIHQLSRGGISSASEAPGQLTYAEPGKPTRQVRAVLARIVEVVGMRHGRQVVRGRLVRGAERGAVADSSNAPVP